MIFNYEPLVTETDCHEIQRFLDVGLEKPNLLKSAESNLSTYLGRPTVTCESGTAGLHLSLLAMGIGPGDEVIVPDLTFAASWNPVLYTGATPVFCDIDPDTWCIDVRDAEKKLSDRTKAIISVDLYGNACDYNELQDLTRWRGLKLIVDAAESLGTKFYEKNCAQYGDVAVTSFNSNKIVTGFGGGAISANNQTILEKARSLLNQAKVGDEYKYNDVGYNYRCHPLALALFNSQIRRINEIIDVKKKIDETYRNLLPHLIFQKATPGCDPNYWLSVINLGSFERMEKVHGALRERKIESKKIFSTGSSALNRTPNIIAHEISQSSLSLPCGPKITQAQIELICECVRSML